MITGQLSTEEEQHQSDTLNPDSTRVDETDPTAIPKSATPLGEVIKEVGHIITCLYKLSIAIQTPTSRDRLEKLEKIDISYFEPHDIEHVKSKHQLPDDKLYLADRLGKANTKRRQLLRYNESHHEKIVGRRLAAITVPIKDDEQDDRDESGMTVYGYLPSELASTSMQTAVSTVYDQQIELV